MARKNLLQGLLDAPPGPAAETAPGTAPGTTAGTAPGTAPAGEAPADAPRAPAPKGAIGAVSRSIAELKARSVLELDPWTIDAGGVTDRLERFEAEDAELGRSIGEYGQQVPVLVRPHPEKEGRWQIVYGRRRVLALRALGRPVKALVRDLDDLGLVMAQGQENTARRDLSFIEKANFARQMEEAGYGRRAVCDALSIDKATMSRMLSVAYRVPVAVIEMVGAAPGVGRDRWLHLADSVEAEGAGLDPDRCRAAIAAAGGPEAGPDARFDALQAHLDRRAADRSPAATPPPAPPKPPRSASRPLAGAHGARLGAARASPKAVVLRLDRARAGGFADWLLDSLPLLHREWLARTGD